MAMIADVLRQTLPADVSGYPNIGAYVEPGRARPAFKKVYADQLADSAAGD